MTPITLADLRAAGICRDGARRWFAGRGLSLRDVAEGCVSAEWLEATGDAQAARVAAIARARHG